MNDPIIDFCQQHQLDYQALSQQIERCYGSLAFDINQHYLKFQRDNPGAPLIVGINAAQGAGKTTISQLLKVILLNRFERNTFSLSIDDCYLTFAQRQELAALVHPLFATRGVPGTHDVSLALSCLQALKKATPVEWPQFDKLRDDRVPKSQWQIAQPPLDIILFEGWCIGAPPCDQASLDRPINWLEQEKDRSGQWRNYWNQQLATSYQALFAQIDYLVYFQAPSWDTIIDWRSQQETRLLSPKGGHHQRPAQRMSAKQLLRFMMHFERLTRHCMAIMPDKADMLIKLDTLRNPTLQSKA